MNHESHKERLKNYSERTGHKVEYHDGGSVQNDSMKGFAPDDLNQDKFNAKTKKKSLQDKMNKAPEYNRRPNLRNQPVRI